MKRINWGLRAKLLLSVGITILIVMGISTIVYIQHLKRNYLEAVQSRSEALSQSVVKKILEFYDDEDSGFDITYYLAGLSQECRALYNLNQDKYLTHIAVLDQSGKVLSHNDETFRGTTFDSPEILKHLHTTEVATVLYAHAYHSLVPVVSKKGTYLAVDVGFPKEVIDQKITQLLFNTGGLYGVFLVLSFFVVSVLVNILVTKPLGQLITVMQEVESGNLGAEAHITTHDEIEEVANAFNTMGGQLQKSFTQQEKLLNELAILNEVGQTLTTRLDVNHVVAEIYQGASRLIDTTNFFITHYDAKKDEFSFLLRVVDGKVEQDEPGRRVPRGGLTEHVIKTRQPLLIQDRMDERVVELGIKRISFSDGRLAVCWVGVPIMMSGRVMGTLTALSYTTSGLYTEHDRDLLIGLANQAAIALENARLFEQAQQEIGERKRAQEALQTLNEELEQRVQERTEELAQAKADLELMLETHSAHADQVEEDLLDRIDATLRESEQRFRVITKTIPIPILVSRRSDQTIVYANDPANVFFDSPVETLIGQKASAFYDVADQHRLEEMLTAKNVVSNYELQGRRGDGITFWGALYIQPLTFNDEPCLLSALYDMTAHKQAKEALAQERNLLRTLIDNLPDFIYVKDTKHRHLLANTALMHLVGATTPEEVMGKTDTELFFPHEAERFYATDQAVIEAGQTLINREDPYTDGKTGTTHWVLTTKVPLRDTHDHVIGLVGISRDITELKRVQEELRTLNRELEQRVKERTAELHEANQALQHSLETLQMAQDQLVQAEKMAALGTLVAGVAHEINTPVGIGITAASFLKSKTEELKARYEDGAMKRSDLEYYLNASIDSTRMILQNLRRAAEQIQSFKQVAVDQVSSEERPFKIRAYIDDLLLSLHPELKRTHHTVTVHCDKELAITSYPGAFSQILTNFILNSLIHGFEHNDQGAILLDVVTKQDSIWFYYSDNGRGMTEEERARIFEPFYTTKRGQGHTGLGLHIVYNLVTQKLSGKIHCESTPGKGTTFIIQLPLTQNEKGG